MLLGSTVPLTFAVVSVTESVAPVAATGASGTGVWALAAAGKAAASRVRITRRRDIGRGNTVGARKFPSGSLALG